MQGAGRTIVTTSEKGPLSAQESPWRQRPTPVTLIALFQFFRAAILLIVASVIWSYPGQRWGPTAFWVLFYIVSNGGGPPGIFAPFLAAYYVVVGYALLKLRKWARNILVVTSGFVSLMWIRHLLLNEVVKGTSFFRQLKPGFEQQCVYGLIFVDGMIFLFLAFYPGVAEAFKEPNNS